MGTLGIGQIFIVLLIVILIFGDLSKIKKKITFSINNNTEKKQKSRKKGS